MRRLTDIQVLIAALIALTVIAVIVTLITPQNGIPLSVRSTDRDGAMALRLWLEQSGYRVDEVLSNPIQLGNEQALFILAPLTPYSKLEAQAVRDWVGQGHTLIVAGDPTQVNDLLHPFGVELVAAESNQTEAALPRSSPVLLSPLFDKIAAEALSYVSALPDQAVVHLYSGNHAVLVSLPADRGVVWVSGATQPFTNLGLADDANAKFVLNLLADVRKGAIIGFDEAKHGFGQTRSISAWLFDTPPGWGILVLLGLTMTYLALNGRRFGRPVPIPEERLRREPVEYIRAIANLFRRSGQRAEMIRHYRAHLRRRLSERYGVDPRLDDAHLIGTIAARDPAADVAALRNLLQRLSHTRISEAELVTAASDVDVWLRKLA